MSAKRAIGKIQSSQTMPASMFELDTTTANQFALPPRMLQSTMWPRDSTTAARSAVRKDVGRPDAKPAATAAVKKNKDDAPDEEENEFAFLPKTMGRLNLVTPVVTEGSVAVTESPVKKPEASSTVTRTKAIGSSSEGDEVGVIMAGIRTSDDAINFFARFGSETPVKFVHLIHDPSPNSYSPYDLLVARGNADTAMGGEYYTMSPAGIVHVCPGDPSACMPLSSWMRQGMMFKILRNIPFYKYFLHRKMFAAWRENVRFLFFAKQRRKLVDRMFYTRLSACDALFAVKKHLLEIQGVKLLNTDLRTSSKDDFIAMQTEFGTAANSKFEEVIGSVTREVERIMEEVNSSYLLSKQDQSTNSSVGYTEIGGGDKAKSLVKLKQEKAQKKIMRQKAKMEHATLTDYIRLVDYMVVQVLVALAVTMTSSFYEEIIRPRKAGVFETMVRFSTSGTAFSPTCMDIRDMLDRLLENMINFVGGVNRVRHLGSNKHLQLAGPNIQAIVRENKRFRTVSALIQQRVVADFERAEEHAQSYESVRPIYDFNVTWDYAEYSSQTHDITSLKSMLELIGNWGKELEKLRNKPIGVLEVDSKRLKGELNPLKEARLQEIKDYIKDEAHTRCVSLLEKYKDSITKLAYRPVFLKDYANQVAAITALRDQEKNMYKQTSQVDQMYNLLRQYEVKVPSEDLVLHEDLHERQMEYRAEIDAAQSYREAKQAEMIATVNVNIAKLQEQVVAIVSRLEDDIFVDTQLINDPERVLEELQLLGQRLETADQLSKNYCSYQRLFGVEEAVQSELDSGKEQFDTLKQLWEVVASWSSKSKFWLEAQFTDLQVEEVDKEVQTFFKDSFGFHKKLGNRVTETLKDRISEFKAMMPNIMDLGNPNMKARHFEKLFKLIRENFYPDMPFSLSFLLKGGIMDFKDAIQETSASASGEAQLEDSLEKIRRAWDKQKFTVLTHRDQKGLFVLGSLEDIFTLLEDNQVTLQTMLGSRYIRGIQDRVDEWEKKLANLSETLDEWLICQRTWMYLENIFGAEDIQKQLPAESQKFLVVDRGWKLIMNRTFNDPRCLSALTPLDSGATLLQTFLMNNEALESIQKSLEEYLETKRMAFPRFYFLSNDELLEIMSQTRDPHAVQPHMSKCFDAIKRIKFGEGRQGHDILGYLDPSGEYVALSESVKAEGAVEAWLLAFEKGMRTALYDNCKKAYKEYPPDEQGSINRKDWLWSYPAQVVIAIDQVVWTYNTSEALIDMEGCDGREVNPEAMEYFLNYSLRQIDAMVDLVRAPLDKQQRMLMGALLTIDVHARDVTRAMVAKQVSSLSDFEWTKQLRYYWEEKEDDVFAKQTNSSFRYGYEYLGNGPRLVITPLTDICYM